MLILLPLPSSSSLQHCLSDLHPESHNILPSACFSQDAFPPSLPPSLPVCFPRKPPSCVPTTCYLLLMFIFVSCLREKKLVCVCVNFLSAICYVLLSVCLYSISVSRLFIYVSAFLSAFYSPQLCISLCFVYHCYSFLLFCQSICIVSSSRLSINVAVLFTCSLSYLFISVFLHLGLNVNNVRWILFVAVTSDITQETKNTLARKGWCSRLAWE